MIQLIGLIAAVAVVGVYFAMPSLGWSLKSYHWANVVTSPLIGLASYQAGAWGALFISVTYWCAAVYALIKDYVK
jgi:hypothetical protein